jgi:hypothetical protein
MKLLWLLAVVLLICASPTYSENVETDLPQAVSSYSEALLAECVDFFKVLVEADPSLEYTREIHVAGVDYGSRVYTGALQLSDTSFLPHRYSDASGATHSVPEGPASPYFDMNLNQLLESYVSVADEVCVPRMPCPCLLS